MNKEEFLKKVNELSYSRSYSDSSAWDKERGFNDCKEKVIKLIPELDIEGMNPSSFKLFREAMTDLTESYKEMFKLQKELQMANRTILELQERLRTKEKGRG